MTAISLPTGAGSGDIVDVLRDLNEVNALLGSVRRQAVQAVLVQFAQTLQQTLQHYQILLPTDCQTLENAVTTSCPTVLPAATVSPSYSSAGHLTAELMREEQNRRLFAATPLWKQAAAPTPSWSTSPSPDQVDFLSSASFGYPASEFSGSPPLLPSPLGTESLLSSTCSNKSLPPLSDLTSVFPNSVPQGISMSGELAALQGLNLDSSFLNAKDGQESSFTILSCCTWEQDVSCLKVYIPLRGVHNDMIRTHFMRHSAEVTIYNLQGRNYVFRVNPTFRPIHPEACYAVASKTKKNVLLTIKKLSSSTKEDKQWRDLQLPA